MDIAYRVERFGPGAEVRALHFDGDRLTGNQFVAYYSDWDDANDAARYLIDKAVADHDAEMARQRRETWSGWLRGLWRAAS